MRRTFLRCSLRRQQPWLGSRRFDDLCDPSSWVQVAQCRVPAAGGPAGVARWTAPLGGCRTHSRPGSLASSAQSFPPGGAVASVSMRGDWQGGFVALIGGTGISACGRSSACSSHMPPAALCLARAEQRIRRSPISRLLYRHACSRSPAVCQLKVGRVRGAGQGRRLLPGWHRQGGRPTQVSR
jgi:hypothetical protein